MDIAISVKNLVKKYGDFTAVNNISFEVKKGEIINLHCKSLCLPEASVAGSFKMDAWSASTNDHAKHCCITALQTFPSFFLLHLLHASTPYFLKTPVLLPCRVRGGTPARSRASHEHSSRSRCWGSTRSASRGLIPKNAGSNRSAS